MVRQRGREVCADVGHVERHTDSTSLQTSVERLSRVCASQISTDICQQTSVERLSTVFQQMSVEI